MMLLLLLEFVETLAAAFLPLDVLPAEKKIKGVTTAERGRDKHICTICK